MSYWPFWAGGIALALVALAHQGLLGRPLGVSGKLSALVAGARGAGEKDAPSEALFFVGVVLGAALVALATGRFAPTLGLHGPGFGATFGAGALGLVALFVGGLLVGFGTRMAGGCTSGHGLVGVSRLSPASLLATACFFGAGIVTSFLVEAWR